ncbi:MAG: hypothetical protein H7Z43_13085 [Clostridia bacterium]|nr:hypothetical protein [Deltaproteobacteria bacterium]
MAKRPTEKPTFAGFIAPETLLEIVRNTAPFLFDRDTVTVTPIDSTEPASFTKPDAASAIEEPLAYWRVVRHSDVVAAPKPSEEAWARYFDLCVASHFATVQTFVPSDVDTKIRNHLWLGRKLGTDALASMRRTALATTIWDIRAVSQRWTLPGNVVSGHNGESLSILTSGMLAHLKNGDSAGAEELEDAVANELAREAVAFLEVVETKGREREMLMLAAAMTHNVGDVDQGLAAEVPDDLGATERKRFAKLAHHGDDRYHGAYAIAAKLYKALLAAEGHRNYPMRALRELRYDPELLMCASPFLDRWGERLARYPRWKSRDKALVLQGLMEACGRVRNQVGYYRAIAGMNAAYPVERLAKELSVKAQKALREPQFQNALSVSCEAFEGELARRARQLLAMILP